MLEIFQHTFIVRGLIAGIIISVIAPLIGVFLVLRRYSLIADTLAHVSLAGVAIGALFGWNPVLSALVVTLVSSLGIDKLRTSKKVFGESSLALFLSGSLALAVVLLSLSHGLNVNLLNYLFGSILTVTRNDIITIIVLAVVVLVAVLAFFKELIFTTFDEEAAHVSGVPTRFINVVFILLSALTVSLAIPIVGVLLTAALIVIPVITALQLKKSFVQTLIASEIISVVSVILGIFLSYYLNIATGGTIVLVMLGIFLALYFWND